jgi:hypothetical protein
VIARPLRFAPLLLLLGCSETLDLISLRFDGPIAAAVLPADAGPWEVPVGFVANSRDGTIVPLDLKMGRHLTDDPSASFLRAAGITTGDTRILADVAVVAGDAGSVTLWAIDSASGQVLRVPYVLSVDADGFPEEPAPTATDPVFVDVDSSGDSPTLTDITLRAGYTTTEDWSVGYDGARWWATGSRSGLQSKEPFDGQEYDSNNLEVSFLLDGTATAGDRFEFSTDTGVREYTFSGALPTALFAQDGRVYVSVASDSGVVVIYNGVTGEQIGVVDLGAQPLGAGAQPGRMTGAPDGRLFVADAALPLVWELRFDLELDPAAVIVTPISVAAPAVDVAWQGGYDREDKAFDHLFVAPVGALRVDVWDLTAQAWVDPNPATQAVEGVFLGAPVVGLAASVGDVWLPHLTEWGASPRVPTVSVATADGFTYMLEASDGCGVYDEVGAYGENTSTDDGSAIYISLDDQGDTSDSLLQYDDATGFQVVPSTCGGVARSETWTVRYDSGSLSWEVEGSLSGVQANRALDGDRYLSDDAAISFVITSGARPPTDGDTFMFRMNEGLRVFRGLDSTLDGTVDRAWEFPGRPVAYETLSGPTGGGWDPVDRRQFVLLPVTDSDFAAQLALDTGKSELIWE